jgi:hypothetical protein
MDLLENLEVNDMRIDAEKLLQYVVDGIILEFNSDEECMKWFNTYDAQDFKSIEEMKECQGKLGFNIGAKRYHILHDFAKDVFEELENEKQFTDDELYMLSDGILALIRSTNEALRLVCDSKSIEVLQEAQKRYKDLNAKICEMLE